MFEARFERSPEAVQLKSYRADSIYATGLRILPQPTRDHCGNVGSINTDGEARAMQGIIVGIGFTGDEAIMTGGNKTKRTGCAANIWNTGRSSMAVTFSYYEIAIVLSLIHLFTLTGLFFCRTVIFSLFHLERYPGSGN